MKHFWPVLLLTLSCKTRDYQSSANIESESRTENSGAMTIPEMDDDSLKVLTKGLSDLSKPDQRFVEMDLSKRISQLDAREIYNSYARKYGPVFGCVDYNSNIFFEDEALIESKQSQKKINQAFTQGINPTAFKMKVSFNDLEPFLKEVKFWQNILAESRKDLMIYPKRSCLFIATKDEEMLGANFWHSDRTGSITVIWTIYGRRTVYTLKSTEPANKKEVLSPPYGSVIAFKGVGNSDGVEPVLHATPGKNHEKSKPAERMAFVTFFEAFKEP
jgi:hypothetical protein